MLNVLLKQKDKTVKTRWWQVGDNNDVGTYMYSFFDFIDYTCLLIALYTTSTLYIQISIELYTDYIYGFISQSS